MNDIPGYQFILIIVVIATMFEFVFESVFKIRTKLQKLFKNKIIYLAFSVIFTTVISLTIELYLKNSRLYPYLNIGVLAIMVFLCNVSYYKKQNRNRLS